MNKQTLSLDLIDQIIQLAEAKDREFIKLLEKYNSNSIYDKKIIPNGQDAIVFHLKILRELLQEEDRRLENIIQPNDHRPCSCQPENNDFANNIPIYEKPIWSNIPYTD
jgi:hypothetical protein